MTTRMYPVHRKSIVRHIALVLAVAGAVYVAGALFHGASPLRGGSAAFVQSVQAAEARDLLFTGGIVPPTDAVDWGRADSVRISQPRECDLAKGISTVCLFMD